MQGRQLASLTTNGKTYTYSYDGDGIRTQKVVDGVTHTYVTQNGKVMRETIGTGATAKVLDFIYDNNGKPFALIYTNGTAEPDTYYYVLNLQGDVVALMTAGRSIVAQYAYNAWGEILSATGDVAEINPLRYRGYYYDTETGFYYLRSRYYDPVNCRFINADEAEYSAITAYALNATNLFAYCGNNPVVNIDEAGTFFCTIIGAVVGAACGALTAAITGEDILAGAVGGAVSGAIAGAAADVIAVTGGSALAVAGVMAGASAIGSVAGDVAEAAINGDLKNGKLSIIEVAGNAVVSACFGGLLGCMGGDVSSKLGNAAKKGLKAVVKAVAKKVVADPLKHSIKEWVTGATEEFLGNAMSDVGEFFLNRVGDMFTGTYNK